MSIFSLDVIPARKGDCFILHYGTSEVPKLAIIDGGPGQVYFPHLKPRLEAIRDARGVDGQAMPVDLLMVSHIDDDHINGILQMTKELRSDPWLNILNFWHNSFDDIVGAENAGTALFEVAGPRVAAALASDLRAGSEGGEIEHAAALVLASAAQGDRLRKDAEALELENIQFGEKQISATDGRPLDMLDGLTFVVAGPMRAELEALNKEYRKFLDEKRTKDRNAVVPAAFTDKSIANLSSIVVLAEFEGTSILFTGDARGDKILEGMALAGLLDDNGERHVDLLKVPHHGSDRNMETGFFEKITADHYVFSGDGEHGNPERETLQMLLDARGVEDDYLVHLTYPVDEIDREREREKTNHGKPWSAEGDSLAHFFARNPDFHAKVRIVDENHDGSPHVIDLLEELGY